MENNTELTLRPYQTECIKKIEEKGDGRWLIAIAVGLGKTVIFTHLPRHGRTLILSHRDELVRQPEKYYGPDVTFGVEKAGEHSHGEDVVSASVQTLSRDSRLKDFKPDDFDTIIVDECFPAGTLVDGRQIENINVGDYVTAFNHDAGRVEQRPVTHVFKRPSPDKLILINGSVCCTGNHPIYVCGKGYVNAENIKPGDSVLYMVREGDPVGQHGEVQEKHVEKNGTGVLFKGMHEGIREQDAFRENAGHKPSSQCGNLGENEKEQSHEGSGGKSEDVKNLKRDPSSAEGSRRKRNGDDGSATETDRRLVLNESRYGIRGSDKDKKRKRVSDLLQDRHSDNPGQDRDRSGRSKSSIYESEGGGQKERGIPSIVRVDSVEVLERGSDGRYEELCRDGHVYNIEVEGLNNYFANGVLVHNCHHCAAPSYQKVLDYFSGARRRLGFTATPKRGDGARLTDVFDEIVCEKSLKWGIENGYLSRIRCMTVRASYDLKGIRKLAGDYSQNELEKRMRDSDAIAVASKTYIEKCHEKGRHTLMYCVTRAICDDLCTTIRDLLPPEERDTVKVLTGETPDGERREMLFDFMNGKVRCIVNCMVLTEGTDLPIADTIMNLRPTCNPSLFEQMVGRGSRLYPDKEYCLVIDVTPKDKTGGLCSAPTLFGIDPEELNEKQLENIDEDHDLLAECERITGSVADVAERMWIEAEERDLFVQKTEDMMWDAFRSGGGFTAITAALRKKREKDLKAAGDIDFKGLVVEVGPDMAKRYAVKPSWDERIYLSEPDVLDNCAIEFDLLADPRHDMSAPRRFSGTMKTEDAVTLARRFCEAERREFSYEWDAGLSGTWGASAATDAQKARVLKDYKKYGATERDAQWLKKGSASTLIDLKVHLDEEKRKRDLLRKAADGERDALNKAEDVLAAPEDAGDGEERFLAFKDEIEEEWRAPAVGEWKDAKEAEMTGAGTKTRYIDVTPDGFGIGEASPKQKKYIRALLGAAASRGYAFTDTDLTYLTKKQAAALIPLLKVVSGLPGQTEKRDAGSLKKIADAAQKNYDGHVSVEITIGEEKPCKKKKTGYSKYSRYGKKRTGHRSH